MKEEDVKALEKDVAGEYNTFRVYLLMLRIRSASVREVARGLGLTSPWLARHHLDKLAGYGLVVTNASGGYGVVAKRFGVLKLFSLMGKWIVPHTLFVAVLFLVMMLGFLPHAMGDQLFAIAFVVSAVGLVFSVLLTIRMYRLLVSS
jgi:hypothetical protein